MFNNVTLRLYTSQKFEISRATLKTKCNFYNLSVRFPSTRRQIFKWKTHVYINLIVHASVLFLQGSFNPINYLLNLIWCVMNSSV